MTTTWTDERCDLLGALWASGYSASQIADKLGGVTRNAVIGKARRSGLAAHPKSSRQIPRVECKLIVHGKHQHIAEVAQQETVVEIADNDIPVWQRRNLLQLEWCHCKYPVGDPKDSHPNTSPITSCMSGNPDFFYCGAPIQKSSVYCVSHHARCYQDRS